MIEHAGGNSLFDKINWRDPMSGQILEPVVLARTPAGVPICGALKISGTDQAYPIVDCVARMTPQLALKHQEWLRAMSLKPAGIASDSTFQNEETVDSFGWQWTWNSNMRTEEDLLMRVAGKFNIATEEFDGKLVADMGAGAGDQSSYLLSKGANVISVDLSSAIEIVSAKLRMNKNWFGVQGDITALPLGDEQFDVVYCEGVIQHTRDSLATIKELARVVKPHGKILAAHYIRSRAISLAHRMRRVISSGIYEFFRGRLSRMERFKLLLVTGNLAALSYVPLLGWFIKKAGLALHYSLMPDFKTTWTNTFDLYGNHSYQRIIYPDEFIGYFEGIQSLSIVYEKDGNIVAEKVG